MAQEAAAFTPEMEPWGKTERSCSVRGVLAYCPPPEREAVARAALAADCGDDAPGGTALICLFIGGKSGRRSWDILSCLGDLLWLWLSESHEDTSVVH